MKTAKESARSRQSDRATGTKSKVGSKGIAVEAPRYGLRLVDAGNHADLPIQRKKNSTGLPDNLRAGIEQLSGIDLSDVRVHFNSSQPTQLHALAYAKGAEIHVAPGQEQHLPHEAWHLVQQAQGRVQPTLQLNGQSINADRGLEQEADVMGAKSMVSALRASQSVRSGSPRIPELKALHASCRSGVIQRNGAISKGQVDFLLREASIAAFLTFAFHASKTSSVEKGILKGGLDPNYGGTGAGKISETFEEHSKGKVHYTRDVAIASGYKSYFEGSKVVFGPHKVVEKPEPAEVLRVSLPQEIVKAEERDPDSPPSDRAFRSTSLIPPENISRLRPTDLPKLKKKKLKRQFNEMLTTALQKGQADSNALFSNMSAEAQELIHQLTVKSGGGDQYKQSVLTMIKNALRTLRITDIWKDEDELIRRLLEAGHKKTFFAEYINALGEVIDYDRMLAIDAWARRRREAELQQERERISTRGEANIRAAFERYLRMVDDDEQ
jgi:hypothetical protein